MSKFKTNIWITLCSITTLTWLFLIIHLSFAQKDTVLLLPNTPKKQIDTAIVFSSNDIVDISENSSSNKKAVLLESVSESEEIYTNSENCINVNMALSEELISLNGIGPVLADRIIVFRSNTKKFTEPSDLMKVKGIGPGKLKKIVNDICF